MVEKFTAFSREKPEIRLSTRASRPRRSNRAKPGTCKRHPLRLVRVIEGKRAMIFVPRLSTRAVSVDSMTVTRPSEFLGR